MRTWKRGDLFLHVECDYGESVRYGDKVVVQLAVTALKPTKVQFRYKVFDGEEIVLTRRSRLRQE